MVEPMVLCFVLLHMMYSLKIHHLWMCWVFCVQYPIFIHFHWLLFSFLLNIFNHFPFLHLSKKHRGATCRSKWRENGTCQFTPISTTRKTHPRIAQIHILHIFFFFRDTYTESSKYHVQQYYFPLHFRIRQRGTSWYVNFEKRLSAYCVCIEKEEGLIKTMLFLRESPTFLD